MKTIKVTTYISTLLLTTLFFTACGSKDKKPQSNCSSAVQVSVEKVETGSNQKFLSTSGKMAASNSANLSTRMMRFVEKIYIDVGDKVRKGQLFISINNANLKAKAAQADVYCASL